MTDVRLEGVGKRYGDVIVVDGVDLEIRSGELFFLLGPSGCGKTTLLRMIAGFVEPSGGRILLGDRDVTRVPPNRRETGMVFQSYALWPHMTVAENVAYGLRVRRIAAADRDARVTRALESVQMDPYADRRPTQLSGGQQQRVALARALVVEPKVLLLDEPLSNLDAKLRLEMRAEIRRLCTRTGITTIYVTHDQKEALSMADRVAVLRGGLVEQLGPPRELYGRPRTKFVADFLGETNFVAATLGATDGTATGIESAVGPLRSTAPPPTAATAGSRVLCSLRPEAIRILDDDGAAPPDARTSNQLEGEVVDSIFLGEYAQHLVRLADGTQLKALESNPRRTLAAGQRVRLAIDLADVVLIADATTG